MKRYTLPFAAFFLFLMFSSSHAAEESLPVPGMVTMIDLGATRCIPCKMMAPILERLGKAYEGKAAIRFIDIWENPEAKSRYDITAIPTQIFYDKNGNERERHTGFLDEESIRKKLDALIAQ